MRNLYFAIAIFSMLLFAATVLQLSTSTAWNKSLWKINIDHLSGFQDSGPNAEAFLKLRTEFSRKISQTKEKESMIAIWWLVVSFIVTGLAAASTLVTTISAARYKERIPVSTIRIIAILTFLATLTTWGSTQLSDSRAQQISLLQHVKDLRTEFFTAYQQAETIEDKKSFLITTYTEKLNDL